MKNYLTKVYGKQFLLTSALVLGVLSIFICFPSKIFSQEIFAPFLIFGYSTEDFFSKDESSSLNNVHESIVKNINPSVQRLNRDFEKALAIESITFNQRNYLKNSFWYAQESLNESKNLTTLIQHQWIVCKGMDVNTIFLESSSLEKQEIFALNHIVLPNVTINRKKTHQPNLNLLLSEHQNHLVDLYQTNLRQIEDHQNKSNNNSALKLDSQFSKASTQLDRTNDRCLQLMAIEPLVSKHKVISFLSREGRETIMQIVRSLGSSGEQTNTFLGLTYKELLTKLDQPLRSNTRLLVDWQSMNQQNQYLANIRLSESVFGQLSADPTRVSFRFNLEGNQEATSFPKKWQVFSSPELETILKPRLESLDPSIKPKVARIQKAWVYLDKGRAWGLRINDRLVVENTGNPTNDTLKSEGHVVGFFGPELNILDANGKRINEGAIVYIRKGQKKIKLGNSVKYDSKTFPVVR